MNVIQAKKRDRVDMADRVDRVFLSYFKNGGGMFHTAIRVELHVMLKCQIIKIFNFTKV